MLSCRNRWNAFTKRCGNVRIYGSVREAGSDEDDNDTCAVESATAHVAIEALSGLRIPRRSHEK